MMNSGKRVTIKKDKSDVPKTKEDTRSSFPYGHILLNFFAFVLDLLSLQIVFPT